MSSSLNEIKEEIVNNTHWFKKLFLGLMGSVALSKAVDSYYHKELERIDFTNISLLWQKIISLPREALTSHIITFTLLVYFFINIVRYYMSIYIYEHFTDQVWNSLSVLSKRYNNILGDKEIKDKINEVANRKSNVAKLRYKKISSTIFDMVLSLALFFMFGISALFINVSNAFAISMLVILVIDLFQIVYQKFIYFPKKDKIEENYRAAVQEVLEAEGTTERISGEDKNKLISDLLAKKSPGEHSKTLNKWIAIDLMEAVCWCILIVLSHFFGGKPTYWLLLPIAAIFCIYRIDIYWNKKSWADMFDINIK